MKKYASSLDHDFDNRNTILVNSLPGEGESPHTLAILGQFDPVGHNFVLDPLENLVLQQLERCRVCKTIVSEHADKINFSERSSTNRQRLHGRSHANLDQHATRRGRIDACLDTRRDTRAVVHAREPVRHAMGLLDQVSGFLCRLQRIGRLFCLGRILWRRRSRGAGDEGRFQTQVKGFCDLESACVDIGDDDTGKVLRYGERRGEEEAHGSSAEDERGCLLVQTAGQLDVLLGRRTRAAHGMQADGKRLGERTAQERDIVRQLMAHVLRVVGDLHQRAIKVREDFGARPEPHVDAEVVAVLFAEEASAAGDTDLERDAVADAQRFHVWADGRHDTRGLVARNHRLP